MSQFDEQKIWTNTQELYNKNRFDDVEINLQSLADKADNPAWYLYLLASVQQERLKFKDALETIKKSIEVNSEWSSSRALRAQLLQQLSEGDLSDLYLAQIDIDTAIRLLPLENTPDSPVEDPGALQGALNNYINTLSGLYSQKNAIDNEIKSKEVLNRIDELDSKIDNERTRSIEVIGIFAAILALILTSVQGAINLKGPDFLWLGLGMIIPISFMVLLVSPKADVKAKFLIQFIVFIAGCIAVGIFIDRWFFK